MPNDGGDIHMQWSGWVVLALVVPAIAFVPGADVDAGILPATLSVAGPTSVPALTPMTYQGRFVLHNGTGVPGVQVSVHFGGGSPITTTTDVTGRYQVVHSFNLPQSSNGFTFGVYAKARPLPQTTGILVEEYTSPVLNVHVRHRMDIQPIITNTIGCTVYTKAKVTNQWAEPITFRQGWLTPVLLPLEQQRNALSVQTGLDGWTGLTPVDRGSPGQMRLTWEFVGDAYYHPGKYVHTVSVSC